MQSANSPLTLANLANLAKQTIERLEPARPRLSPTVDTTLPAKHCPCGCGRFWLSANGWRCLDCHPMPDGVFMGETCTVDSPNPLPIIETPQAEPETVSPAWVRCSECKHHIPSETDPKHGIGRCGVDSPALLRPSPWPGTERRCGKYQAREGAECTLHSNVIISR